MKRSTMKSYFEEIFTNRIFKLKLVSFILNYFKKPPLDPINETIRIPIDQRWDSFPDPEGKRMCFFAGRDEDLAKLKNWIAYSDGGSVLVRGFRGVGKSAFVYQAISESTESLLEEGKPLLFVPVNFAEDFGKAPDFEFSEETKVLTRIILSLKESEKNLNDGKLEDLNYLFDLAISSKAEQKTEESKKWTFSSEITLSFVFFIITYFLQLVFSKSLPSYLVALASPLILPIPASIPLLPSMWQYFSKKDQTTFKNILLNNPNYLSMKLRRVLDCEEMTPVFVIDELDKLFNKDGNNPVSEIEATKKINDIIRKLKYLFTLSQARFIFIVHEEYPHWRDSSKQGRPEESTYFNWDIFLSGITLGDIQRYIEGISLRNLGARGSILLDEFVHYISFDSKRIFSEINQILRNYIKYEDGKPYLEISDFKRKDSPDLNKMRMAVIENILDSVLNRGEEIDSSLKEREHYHKTYLFLRKIAGDIAQNRFLVGDLSTYTINTLVHHYSSKTNELGTQNLDFVCDLLPHEEKRMQKKIRDFLSEMQLSAFSESENITNKVFFDGNNSNDVPITSSYAFEDIDIGGLPKILHPSLPQESLEFKIYIDEFKNILNKLKTALKSDDDVKIASSVFGDEGLTLLSAVKLADKIVDSNPKTHHLYEIRKMKEENPNILNSLQMDPTVWIKNWLSTNLVEAQIDDIPGKGRGGKIGFRVSVGSNSILFFNKNYNAYLSKKIQNELKDALIFRLNGVRVDLSYGKSKKIADHIDLHVDIDNLEKLNVILNKINERILIKYDEKDPKLVLGNPEGGHVSFINIKGKNDKSLIANMEFTIKSDSEYWRAGFLLGQNSTDKYEPLATTGYPLFHIYKDIGDPQIKLHTYSKGQHPPDTNAKDTGVVSTSEITLRLEVAPNNLIRLFVNERPIYNSIIDLKFLRKASILVWGDGKAEFTGANILNYKYSEIL